MNAVDYFSFFLIGVVGLILGVAGVVLIIGGFVKDNLGFKIGGLVALVKAIFFLFIAFFGLIAYLSE